MAGSNEIESSSQANRMNASSTSAPAEFLAWDSEFFGFRIGRVLPGPFNPSDIEIWRRKEQIRCLYYLAELEDTHSIHAAESIGFRLMDIRTTFFLSLPLSHDLPLKQDFTIRQAQPQELDELINISTGIFCNARFYQDPHFSTQRVDQMYNRWLENHFQQSNTCIWVAEGDNGILGFTSIETTPKGIARLSLTGIQSSARRRGTAKALKKHIIDYYSKAGFAGLESITQGRNCSLININFSFGFKLISQQLWYHGWFSDDD